MHSRKFPFLLAFSIAGSAIHALPGDPAAVQAFPDYQALRADLLSSVVIANKAAALAFPKTYRSTSEGDILIQSETAGTYFYAEFLRERDGDYPYASKGNVIVQRSMQSGYMLQAKWFLADDAATYLRLSPSGQRTKVELVVAGSLVSNGIMPAMIYYYIAQSFKYLHDASAPFIDWPLVLRGPSGEGPRAFAASLRDAAASRAETDTARKGPDSLAKARRNALADQLLAAAAGDFREPGRFAAYLKSVGRDKDGTQLRELVAAPSIPVAIEEDERDVAPFQAPGPWTEASGYELRSVPHILFEEAATAANVYVALVDDKSGAGPAHLALVPYFAEDGTFRIDSWDARTMRETDFHELARTRGFALARVYALPLPANP